MDALLGRSVGTATDCVSLLRLLTQWMEEVIGWLSQVFLQEGASPDSSSTVRRWRCHVQRFFYRLYASMRIEELFSIIRGEGALALELSLSFRRAQSWTDILCSLKQVSSMGVGSRLC